MLADPVKDILQAALRHAPICDPELVTVSLHLIKEELGLEAFKRNLIDEVTVELADQDRVR